MKTGDSLTMDGEYSLVGSGSIPSRGRVGIQSLNVAVRVISMGTHAST